MASSPEARKRANRAYFERNRNNPEFRAKRVKWAREWRNANPDFYVTPHHRYSILRCKSKHRKMDMNLTFETYKQLIEGKNCHYCGISVFSSGSGLDRIDSSKGYIVGNCVPCCYRCNVMKADLAIEDFYEHVERILDFRSRNGRG